MGARMVSGTPDSRGASPRAGASDAADLAALAAALVVALDAARCAANRLRGALETHAACRADVAAPSRAQAAGAGCGQRAALSAREAEVLALLAAGHSNHQIARALFLSPRTAQRHVANIYAKIGAHCRAEATAYALRHGLA